MTTSQDRSFYDAVGGHATFVQLVTAFYAGVASDPELRSLYPDEDLTPAQERLTMFLEQYWGGPTTYSDRRGHPRLGRRHAPFKVTAAARDHWLAHMRAAVEQSPMAPAQAQEFWEYVVKAAHFLVNTFDEEPPPVAPGPVAPPPAAPSRAPG